MRKIKDSGIRWIGQIPEDWELRKIKYILRERNEKNNPIKTSEILSLTASQGVIPYAEKEGGGNRPKEDLSAYKLAYPDDIVMNSMNVLSGSVGLSKFFGCVSPVYYTFYSDDENIDIRFYNYIFKTKAFQRSLMGLGNGILIKESESGSLNTIRMRIPLEKLNGLFLVVPDISEQKKIVRFLDEKVSEIDSIIAKTKESIEDYKKYKQAVITEAVTKGLDKTVSMKDSGIEWIEQIPEDWDVIALKKLFSFGKGLSITKADLVDDGEPVISYGQIHSKVNKGVGINDTLIRYVSDEFLQSNPQSLVERNDFIFADTSEDLNGSGNYIYIDEDKKLFAGYHTIIAHPNKNENYKYLAYLFLTDNWRSQIRSRVTGIKLFSVSQKILRDVTVILPSIKHRTEIVEYLDKKVPKIDDLIAKKVTLIEELESYKKSLIYEYVTGKKEVL